MNLRSLGYRTDLIFARYSGEVHDRGDHLVVRTPSNPTFWWGNFVIFDRAPTAEDARPWLETFRREVPYAKHVAIGWDGQEAGDVGAFEALGLSFQESVVMTASSVNPPPKVNTSAEYRVLESDADWDAWLELRMACNDDHEPDGYRVYLNNKRREYRRMGDDGRGGWFGAFLDGRLVCGMGLYTDGEIARFQSVETHPDFRRLGLCGSLVHHTATVGLRRFGASTLVMLADPEYHAARIYESVGFQPTEKAFALERSGDKPPLEF